MAKKEKTSGEMLIKNGHVYTASDSFKADILIKNGKIAEIAARIAPRPGAEVIDAAGLEIYPGGIDVHTHFSLPFMGTVSADDFETGTRAAACGGTTTIVDFAIPAKGGSTLDALKAWHKKADGKAVIDYGFHMAMVDYNDQVAAEIPQLVKEGVTSFKCFLAYKGVYMVDDATFLEVLTAAKKNGVLVSIHAENGDMLSYVMKHLVEEGHTGPQYHPVAHPASAEGEAVHRGLVLAKAAGAPLYIVHLSSNEGLKEIKGARERGQKVLAETCPQYLLLDDELYMKEGFEAAKWVMSPPLRDRAGQKKLWEGLRDGFIQTVATDHCSFNFKGQKEMGKDNFLKIPNGIPAVGDRVNLLYTYGVKKGRLDRNRFAAIISTNPARIFGLYPEKGAIAPGSDADLLIMDPHKKGKVSKATSHHNVDYSAFEGFELEGMPALVISRGEIVSRDNKFIGAKGRGKFIKRKKYDASAI